MGEERRNQCSSGGRGKRDMRGRVVTIRAKHCEYAGVGEEDDVTHDCSHLQGRG